ncbi:MAG: S41 family peptidase [Bacteroidia bacterium]|nr:S41 family peptidase [Bacteroidia bacterium]
MNKNIWKPFIYALLIVSGLLLGIWLKPNTNIGGFFSSGKNKINQTLHIINQAYVDSVNSDSLENIAIDEILKQLDPHSVYIKSTDVKQVNEGLEGNFEGVGIEFTILDDTIFVANVIKDGPSQKAGIMNGDRIIKVDTQLVAGVGITSEQVFKTLRGAAGSKVNVTVYREESKRVISYSIKRGQIPIYSIDASLMLNNQTGYIKIERFAANTHEEFAQALQKLQGENMKDLILDLRGNPGGYLSAATEIANEFLDNKKLIVYTQSRNKNKTEYKAEQSGNFETGKLIILIDEGSASASEIVSGAVQDWDRGVIIGRRSFGKGLVQEPFTLSDGSVIRLTISRYYTPSGRSIQKDYTNGVEEYEHEIVDRFIDGESMGTTSHKQTDSTIYKTANGRIVYGGGGIMPDVFVPMDTNYFTSFYSALFENKLLQRFVYSYSNTHRNKLMKNYSDAATFNSNFKITDELWNEFLSFVKSKSKNTFKQEDINKSAEKVRLHFKALLAKQLWQDEGYLMVINSEDRMIKEALKTLGTNYRELLKPKIETK